LGALTGKSQKCDACAGPRARGEAPACVAACPAYCLEFGDLQLFEKERGPGFAAVHPLSTDKNATEPSVLIKLRKNRYAEN
ncbi:MAG: 4Fe-4S ferredoxin, partial [Spirochaetes bacterium]|nr:4Fe-4S ferredoxin [Spirochaetota bacterium]